MTGQPVHQRHDIHMCKVDGAHCQPEEPCWLLGDQDSSTELQPVAFYSCAFVCLRRDVGSSCRLCAHIDAPFQVQRWRLQLLGEEIAWRDLQLERRLLSFM
mmetsp:Transcript_6974/g.21386  ORF Transcript_6974/g.21386 Transcript_6974/m.21386 type:complete len:101 (+) Transcript_6974:776-1078(+)